MPMPIGLDAVERALRPWLGTLFLSSNGFAQGVTRILQAYAPYRQTFEELHEDLDRYVVTGLNKLTHGSMRVVTADYRTVRLTLRDINWLTDDLMGVLFDSLTPFSANYTKINDYSLRMESLSALRVLYMKYDRFMTDEERAFLARMVKELYPEGRYGQWLR